MDRPRPVTSTAALHLKPSYRAPSGLIATPHPVGRAHRAPAFLIVAGDMDLVSEVPTISELISIPTQLAGEISPASCVGIDISSEIVGTSETRSMSPATMRKAGARWARPTGCGVAMSPEGAR